MPLPLNLQRQLARFKRLPEKDDVWEGEVRPLPAWIDRPDGVPYRATGAVWASTIERLANLGMADIGSGKDEDLALSALLEMGTSAKLARYRPRGLRVRDEQLAARLRDTLAGLEIEIDVVPE